MISNKGSNSGEVPKPERPIKSLSVAELFDQYRRVGIEEAPGILHAIADKRNADYPFPQHIDVLTPLCFIGREADEPWESNETLRQEARRIILRKVAAKTLQPKRFVYDAEMYEARMCVSFFAEDERHARLSNRDRETLIAFLSRYCDCLDARNAHVPHNANAIWAAAYAGANDLLRKRFTAEKVIEVLQSFLYLKLVGDDPYFVFPRHGTKIVPPTYGIGTTAQVMALCGAVTQARHLGPYAGLAETLLVLRARCT